MTSFTLDPSSHSDYSDELDDIGKAIGVVPVDDEDIEKYDTSTLETKPGKDDNWIERKGGTLDPFIRAIAHALIRNGKGRSQAIAIAIGTVKRWASGGGNVTPKTRAKAAKAVANWEKLKKADTTDIRKEWAAGWGWHWIDWVWVDEEPRHDGMKDMARKDGITTEADKRAYLELRHLGLAHDAAVARVKDGYTPGHKKGSGKVKATADVTSFGSLVLSDWSPEDVQNVAEQYIPDPDEYDEEWELLNDYDGFEFDQDDVAVNEFLSELKAKLPEDVYIFVARELTLHGLDTWELHPDAATAYGYVASNEPTRIVINRSHIITEDDRDQFLRAAYRNVESGWHVDANTDPVVSLFEHESGHALDFMFMRPWSMSSMSAPYGTDKDPNTLSWTDINELNFESGPHLARIAELLLDDGSELTKEDVFKGLPRQTQMEARFGLPPADTPMRRAMAKALSRYGSYNDAEMIAEMWCEYLGGHKGGPPRPNVQAAGDYYLDVIVKNARRMDAVRAIGMELDRRRKPPAKKTSTKKAPRRPR